MSPICVSSHAELNDANIDYCENYLEKFIQRWFDWLDEAEELPVEKGDEQMLADPKRINDFLKSIERMSDLIAIARSGPLSIVKGDISLSL